MVAHADAKTGSHPVEENGEHTRAMYNAARAPEILRCIRSK
jgi:hypothetical protein